MSPTMTLLRRLVFFIILILTAIGMTLFMAHVLSLGGWTLIKTLMLVCFVGIAPWLGICAANAILGFATLILSRDPTRAVLPVAGDIDHAPITARVAIALTVRNEAMESVLSSLEKLIDSLQSHNQNIPCYILSDTQDPSLVEAEARAIAAFPHPVHYRRRLVNTGFKAGNVMDFLDHHADGYELAVMLDADSVMSAEAIFRLIRIMQADPKMGIVQHLTAGLPAERAFPRLFQFGMRAGMRVWATGQAWWQQSDGPYWGHNAILRIAPFRTHCRLQPLPNGQTILSHDQIEAAMMRAAGWKVCVWAAEEGSQEANPPALPEFQARDSRWLAGNFQYFHLLGLPGLRAMGQWQLVQAIMLFAGSPLYGAIMLLAALSAAMGDGDAVPFGMLAGLMLSWAGILYSPKLLGYIEVLGSPQSRAKYGGTRQFLCGMVAEFGFTLLLDALAPPSKTLAMIRLWSGTKATWLPQNRTARGVGWGEATRLYWPHTLCGIVLFSLLGMASWRVVLGAIPFMGGMVVAIPFCVLTADPAFSAWVRRRGIAAIPEEI